MIWLCTEKPLSFDLNDFVLYGQFHSFDLNDFAVYDECHSFDINDFVMYGEYHFLFTYMTLLCMEIATFI